MERPGTLQKNWPWGLRTTLILQYILAENNQSNINLSPPRLCLWSGCNTQSIHVFSAGPLLMHSVIQSWGENQIRALFGGQMKNNNSVPLKNFYLFFCWSSMWCSHSENIRYWGKTCFNDKWSNIMQLQLDLFNPGLKEKSYICMLILQMLLSQYVIIFFLLLWITKIKIKFKSLPVFCNYKLCSGTAVKRLLRCVALILKNYSEVECSARQIHPRGRVNRDVHFRWCMQVLYLCLPFTSTFMCSLCNNSF